MYLEKLSFRNFGPFRSLELDLALGSIGVFGANGSGKSTLLNGAYALLSSDFSRFAGLKADNINTQADASEPSFVAGTVVKNGVRATIRRSLSPARQELRIDGEEPIASDKGIRERLTSFMGVDRDTLARYIFKDQGGISDIFSDEPAARAKAFQTLCKTEDCEAAWTLLGHVLNRDTELATEIVDNSDDLAHTLRETEKHVKDLEARLQVEQAKLLNATSLASAETIITKQRICEESRRQKAAVESELATLEIAARAAERTAEVVRDGMRRLAKQLAEANKAADAARTGLAGLEQVNKDRQRKQGLLEYQKDLHAEIASRPKPPGPAADSASLQTALELCRSAQQQAKEALARLDKTGVVACPTCGTPVTSLHGHIEKLRNQLRLAPDELAHRETLYREAKNLETALRHWENWHAGALRDQEAVAKQLADLADVNENAAPGNDAAYQRDILLANSLAADHARAAEECLRVERIMAGAKSQRDLRQSDLDRTEQALADNQIDAALAERVQRRLAEHKEATHALALLEGELKPARATVASVRESLRKLREQLARRRRLNQMAKVLTRARDVLHRDSLPRGVAQVNLARIEAEVNNDGLKLFGSPFWVEAQEDLTFLVHKPAEPPQKQGRLSTGQRVVLALAFWAAVGLLWSSELGMLCLDEPTANLDADNRRYLGEALGQLTARIRGNRQIIMVTHDHALRGAFDQVIDLDALQRETTSL